MIVLNALFPIFGLLILGSLLKSLKLTTDSYLKVSDKLVYFIFFPIMLFWKVGGAPHGEGDQLLFVGVTLMAMAMMFVISTLVIIFGPVRPFQAGTFSQSCYRFNTYIGVAVILNSLGEAAGDYLVALRPRLEGVAKAQAIIEAFAHLDKPYDFDFDFATDHALVCTELVWRSYRGADGKAGLELPLVQVAGRLTLPANEIARVYAEEYGSPEAQFDFVYFLDGRERELRAVVGSEESFRGSHQRFKWDIFQR